MKHLDEYLESMKEAPRWLWPYYIFGGHYHGISYQKIGRVLGISRQRVHQIYKKTLEYYSSNNTEDSNE